MDKRYDSICESLMRGNEIQFVYNSEQFFLMPYWDKNTICGFYIGKSYGNDMTVLNRKTLKEYSIQGKRFIDIVEDLDIIDSDFKID